LKKKRGNFCLFQKGNFLLSFFRIFSSSSSSSSFPLLPKRIIFSQKIKGWRERGIIVLLLLLQIIFAALQTTTTTTTKKKKNKENQS
jgi:hypothetical protein